MRKIDFNKDWFCRRMEKDAQAYAVTLPHDAMISEPRTNDSMGERNIGFYIGGDYEYTKTWFCPKEYEGLKLILEFESVYHNAKVYVNGKEAMFRPYGYTNFYVDLAKFVRYGEENEIRVIAENKDQPNSRWYSGTGIYRPVNLFIGDKQHIELNGIKIKTKSIRPAVVDISVHVQGQGTVKIEILDGDKIVAAEEKDCRSGKAVFETTVPDAKLWDTENPNLYTLRTTFGEDVVYETFGIRELTWTPEKGIAINGEHIILKGACFHHDNGLLGACAFPEAEERKVRVLKEAGYNALRSSHNPCSKAMLDACDRLGVLMMDEYVDVWYIHKTKNDYAVTLADWWKQDLKDMVDKDYNHPSVIMYSTGNEVAETSEKKGIKFTGEMTHYLHALDGTRPVTCGINIFFNFLYSIGLGVYSDDKAEAQAKDTEKKKGSDKKPVGSEFYNTLAILVGDYFMKCGATLPMCDWKTKDAYANMDIAGYNYGLFRYKHDLKKYKNRLILGSETFCKDAYAFYEIAKKNPRIVGDFVWTGIDYIGEVGDGCAEYSMNRYDDPYTRMTGENGRVDLLGKRRAEAAYTRVAFEEEMGPILACHPVSPDEKAPRITGWQLTKALESWSWDHCAGKEAVVEVYARAYEVELFLNGKSIGKKKMGNNCRKKFTTNYQPGELKAVSYDRKGNVIGEYTLVSAKEDSVKLSIRPETDSVKPEGLCFINLQYTDAEGVWKPVEKHELKVTVENGTLAGLGSANGYTKHNYTDSVTETLWGEAQAIIRGGKEGSVKVTIEDESNVYTLELPIR